MKKLIKQIARSLRNKPKSTFQKFIDKGIFSGDTVEVLRVRPNEKTCRVGMLGIVKELYMTEDYVEYCVGITSGETGILNKSFYFGIDDIKKKEK